MNTRSVVLLASVLYAACTPPQPNLRADAKDGTTGILDAAIIPPVPVVNASPATACANLARLGCPEGLASNCPSVLARVVDAHLTNVSLSCLSLAQHVTDVQACGAVACLVAR